MGKLIRCITSDGAVMATAVDTTDIAAQAEQYHKTSAVVTAALGRLLTAASMMGNMLKDKDNSITLKITGDGPIGTLVAASDSDVSVWILAPPLVDLVEVCGRFVDSVSRYRGFVFWLQWEYCEAP